MKFDSEGLFIQDIVTASPTFDMDVFVPQLKEALTVMNPRKRNFLISWIRVLSSVPDIEILNHLADLLEGLTDALQENWPPEVRMNASRCLQVYIPWPPPTHKKQQYRNAVQKLDLLFIKLLTEHRDPRPTQVHVGILDRLQRLK